MRIAINIEHFLESKGGAERYAVSLANAMAEKGHDVHILAYSWYEGGEKDFHCHRVPYFWSRLFRDIIFVRASWKERLKEKFDICLSFSRAINPELYQPRGGLHIAYLERELKSVSHPFLRAIKSFLLKISLRHFLIKKIERAIFKQRNLIVVAISEMVKNDILTFYNFPEENIKVIFNAIDLEKFNPKHQMRYQRKIRDRYSIDDNDLLILFVANNFRLKGLRNLIYAVALMKKEIKQATALRVLVVGKGKKAPYERLAFRLGCKNEFIFTGQSKEINKFYAAADVLAQPTFYDPCSRSTLEAMASGLPVITTIFNGASEIIVNGKNGYVIDDPQNHRGFCNKLLIFANKDIQEKMGQNASKMVKNHSVQGNIEEILSLCEELIENKQKR